MFEMDEDPGDSSENSSQSADEVCSSSVSEEGLVFVSRTPLTRCLDSETGHKNNIRQVQTSSYDYSSEEYTDSSVDRSKYTKGLCMTAGKREKIVLKCSWVFVRSCRL